MSDCELQFIRAALALPTPPASHARKLLKEVDRLRAGLLDIACRAEDGMSTNDVYAHVADLLDRDWRDVRREVEQR